MYLKLNTTKIKKIDFKELMLTSLFVIIFSKKWIFSIYFLPSLPSIYQGQVYLDQNRCLFIKIYNMLEVFFYVFCVLIFPTSFNKI